MEKDSSKAIVIAGGGLTGLMSALRLKKLQPQKKIVVFDKSIHVGGMYGSTLYPDDVFFDNGMHVIYESCNPEVDSLYMEVMPENEWNIHENNNKDIAGLFFRGRLQTYSHYVDLRSEPSRNSFISSFFLNLETNPAETPKSAMDFLRNQFGEEIVEAIHLPILKMMYGVDPENLDVFAAKATALERVILFDPLTMLDLMKSSNLRGRLAYPDQVNLPAIRENTQRALYPKKFGMSHFIDKLRAHLESIHVEILTETDISAINLRDGRIENVVLSNNEWGDRILNVDKVLWTVGWPSLARQLGLDISYLKFQRGPEIVFMNLVFDRPLKMDRLYYFYCYDAGFATFRVTNYANYCPAAAHEGHFPICVELWPSKIGKKRADMGQDECVGLVIDELRRFGVIDADHKLVFSKMENIHAEFPMPTRENTGSLQAIRNLVAEQKIDNLSVVGIMAKDGLFFLPDILNDAFFKLNDF